jgi:RHS repeat-associated protein
VSDIENISTTNGNLNLSIPLASLPPIAGGKLGWTINAIYNSKLWDSVQTEEQDTSTIPPTRFMTSHLQVGGGGWTIGGAYRIEVHESREDVAWLEPLGTGAPPGGGADCEGSSDPDCRLLQDHPTWYKVSLTTPDGAEHELRPIDGILYTGTFRPYLQRYSRTTPHTTQAAMNYYSYDGSYLWARIQPWGPQPTGVLTDWEVYLPDGTAIVQRPNGNQRIWDTNGNNILIDSDPDGSNTVTSYKDTRTGREIRILTPPTPGDPVSVQYKEPGGLNWVTTTINFTTTSPHGWSYQVGDSFINGNFCSDKAELITFDGPVDLIMIDSIVLPETETGVIRQFEFDYNSDDNLTTFYEYRPECGSAMLPVTSISRGLGSLSRMKTPSGAEVLYSYSLDIPVPPQGQLAQASVLQNPNDIPGETITQKKLMHDGTSDTWTFGISNPFGVSHMTGPDGSFVHELSYPHDPAFQYTHGGLDGKGGLTYRTNQSDRVLIERKWKHNAPAGTNPGSTGSDGLVPFNPVVDIEFTTLMDPPGTPAKMSAKKFTYDFNGNVTSETDYDWFSPTDPGLLRDAQGVPEQVPAGAQVLRVVNNTYYNDSTAASSSNVYHKRTQGVPEGNPPTPLILNAPRTTVVGPSQSKMYYDGSDNLDTPPAKGNLTKLQQAVDGTFISTLHEYDTYGNLTSTTDPKLNVTTLVIDSATHAQPVSVTVDPNPDPQVTGDELVTLTTYDFATGLVTSVTDPNGKTSTTNYDNLLLSQSPNPPTKDPFGRPGTVTDPLGRKIQTRYHDDARQLEVWSDLNTSGDAKLRTRTTSDQLGRVTKTESSEDGSTYTLFSESVYHTPQRTTFTSNPRRSSSSPTDGWTRATSDLLGRVVEVATFPGTTLPADTGSSGSTGVVTTIYNAHSTTVTDQALKVRRSVVDGLGRLVEVDEPGTNGSLNQPPPNQALPAQPTNYTYDVLGNLITVVQGSQTRTFTYDALSRLKTANNPESGAVNYTYDNNSNLETKTDARSVVTTFTYDGLNRVLTRTYPGNPTPAVTYVYDSATPAVPNSKGRLVSVSSSATGFSSSCSYTSYDAAGRVLTSTQTTDGQAYNFSYSYDLAGNMKTETYPSGRVVTMSHDSAGRLNGLSGQKPGDPVKTYASSFSYTAHGAVGAMQLGNTKWEHTTFNSRLQPTLIGLGTSSSDSSLMSLDYTYGVGATNNGNVMSQRIRIGGGTTLDVTQGYTYDELNRLKTATENVTGGAQTWQQTYDCDRYGNRAVRVGSLIPTPALTPQSVSATDFSAFNQGNNRIALGGFGYDAAGNLTSDPTTGLNAMVYDGENRMTSYSKAGATTTYSYDGDGRRVRKVAGTGPSAVTTVFVYNAGGQLIAEYSTASPQGSGTSYLTSDHLGSTRVVTSAADAGGNVTVKARYDYLPFGEELPLDKRPSGIGFGGADSTRQKFTQKERDSESGLDYFLARYYSSAQGRFTSPDEFTGGPDDLFDFADAASTNPTFYADLQNPQSLNKYQYAYGNPLRYIDPDGHDPEGEPDSDPDPQSGQTPVLPPAPLPYKPYGVQPGDAQRTRDRIKYEDALRRCAGGDISACDRIVPPTSDPFRVPGPPGPDVPGAPGYRPPQLAPTPVGAEHRKARPSTKPKHEKGQRRKKPEKADPRRRPPLKPDHDHVGPWPVKPFKPDPANPDKKPRKNPCPNCRPKIPQIEPKQ